jgi:transposase
MRYIRLTEEERQGLEDLHKSSLNSVVRERSFCLLLSDKGNSMKAISRITGVEWLTIVRRFNSWDQAAANEKFTTLFIAVGRGPKVKLNDVKDLLPKLVEKHNRNLNPILEILEKEHNIKVCKLTLHNFLKGIGL